MSPSVKTILRNSLEDFDKLSERYKAKGYSNVKETLQIHDRYNPNAPLSQAARIFLRIFKEKYG